MSTVRSIAPGSESAARADETKLDKVSVKRALEYLDKGTQAWNGRRRCVTCHTNGTYMMTRPALTPQFGYTTHGGERGLA